VVLERLREPSDNVDVSDCSPTPHFTPPRATNITVFDVDPLKTSPRRVSSVAALIDLHEFNSKMPDSTEPNEINVGLEDLQMQTRPQQGDTTEVNGSDCVTPRPLAQRRTKTANFSLTPLPTDLSSRHPEAGYRSNFFPAHPSAVPSPLRPHTPNMMHRDGTALPPPLMGFAPTESSVVDREYRVFSLNPNL
jgi:hypothetical protein